jgi:hypothetical protein
MAGYRARPEIVIFCGNGGCTGAVVLRPSLSRLLSVVGVAIALATPGAVVDAEPAGQSGKAGGRKRAVRPAFEEFQVAAGTTLPIELRTGLSSNSSRRADVVEGRLLRPVTAGEVELVPAGATVMGAVSDAEPAGKQPGRLAFAFHVIEHPQTGSRATIKTAARTFESAPPVKGKIYTEVVLEKGADASVLLVAPLIVRLPR